MGRGTRVGRKGEKEAGKGGKRIEEKLEIELLQIRRPRVGRREERWESSGMAKVSRMCDICVISRDCNHMLI